MGEVGGVTEVAHALAMACSQQAGSLISGLVHAFFCGIGECLQAQRVAVEKVI
jgi:hypothetical protein